jgi:putative oxidoreductase
VSSRAEDAALLLGRLFVAALFLPSGVNKLLAFSSFAASLAAKGLPYPTVIAALLVAAEVVGPIALIAGAWPRWTALALVALAAVTLWIGHRHSGLSVLMRPSRNVEFYRTVAIMGGLLFYFASGPGAWSWRGGAARGA